jgi:hypothetical protein
MARGWESKAVESQIEEAESRPASAPKLPPDPAQMERRRTRESLQLARKRVVHDLETSHSFRMEQTLRSSLKHLDEKIAELQ